MTPPTATAEKLDRATRIERATYRRAVEAVLWGMPIVNYDLMFQAAVRELKGKTNQIVYWSRLFDWKNQTLTPNPDVIYLEAFFDTKAAGGPMVLEIPPAEGGVINGSIMDCWQTAFEDVGPAGVDQGKGGKYLILPAGWKDATPSGYIPLRSDNHQGYALLRSILQEGGDAGIAKAVAYAKRIKLYPLSQAANPPQTTFLDAINVVFDSTIPYDLRFFQSLDRMVQYEPWLTRDKAMIDVLQTIGIEKGKPFRPDEKSQAILAEAIAEAHGWFEDRYQETYDTPFAEGARWTFPASKTVADSIMSNFADPDTYPRDGRGLLYTFIFFSAKHVGQGQYYLVTLRDEAGDPLDGGKSYRLRVPAKAPVTQYWSAVVYDAETHAFLRDMTRMSRSSQSPELVTNADGSVDVYFGPKAPAGKDSNWIPTTEGRGYEVMMRFYGPEKALFDHTWKLPDIERMG